jgi:aminoglycoside phosphotransferase (APT) family kinase protein
MKAGLSADGARLISSRANAVYLLARPPIVARLRYAPDSAEWLARLTASVQVTTWLSTAGFPAVRPLDIRQPVTGHGYIVTFWHYVPEPGRRPDGIPVLARLIRELHSLPPPPVQLPSTNPLGSLREDVSRCAWLTTSQRSWLLSQCADLGQQYKNASWPLGCGLLHGDAYTDNLIHARDGAVLADWDSVSYGPREQDVVPTRMRYRFGEPPSRWEEFCQAYGVDPRMLADLPVLLRMRELRSLSPYIRSRDPAAQAEVTRRIADLTSGRQDQPWTALNVAH